MNSTVAERKLLEALTQKVLPTADRKYETGETVLVQPETEEEWLAPFEVICTEGRTVTVYYKK